MVGLSKSLMDHKLGMISNWGYITNGFDHNPSTLVNIKIANGRCPNYGAAFDPYPYLPW